MMVFASAGEKRRWRLILAGYPVDMRCRVVY